MSLYILNVIDFISLVPPGHEIHRCGRGIALTNPITRAKNEVLFRRHVFLLTKHEDGRARERRHDADTVATPTQPYDHRQAGGDDQYLFKYFYIHILRMVWLDSSSIIVSKYLELIYFEFVMDFVSLVNSFVRAMRSIDAEIALTNPITRAKNKVFVP
jgi:hypothetical protein